MLEEATCFGCVCQLSMLAWARAVARDMLQRIAAHSLHFGRGRLECSTRALVRHSRRITLVLVGFFNKVSLKAARLTTDIIGSLEAHLLRLALNAAAQQALSTKLANGGAKVHRRALSHHRGGQGGLGMARRAVGLGTGGPALRATTAVEATPALLVGAHAAHVGAATVAIWPVSARTPLAAC